MRPTLSIACLCLLAVAKTASAAGVTVPLSDFTIFAGGGVTFSGGDETSIGGHTLVNGNIGSNQDLFMQGNPELGYPAQLNGSAYAGGNITFGQDLTVGSASGPLRDVIANGSTNIGGGTNVYGNVYGNAVTLGQNSGVRQVGGAGGNVEYNASYSPSNATVEGGASSPSTKTFNLISMPTPTVFSAGGANQTVPNGQGNSLTLAPGTYGALATSSQNQTVNLTSGNYFFNSLTAQGGFTLRIDLTSGAPVNLYDVGNATFGQNNVMLVKGAGTGGVYVPISQAQQLASLIYFETKGQFSMGGAADNSHNVWGGTVYASQFEGGNTNAAVSIGQYTDWYGHIFAYDSVNIADHGLIVPEPGTIALFGLGALTLVLRPRRNRR